MANRERAPRGRRRLRLGLLAVGGLLGLAMVTGAVLFAVTPGVWDAPARVRALAVGDGAAQVDTGVPRLFTQAIVASEDSRFYSEPGIDPIGIARAAWMTVTGSAVDPGGSTLSQQLAKQLYTHGRTGFLQDIEQVTLAVKLNLDYSKAQILQMYAATVYFGHGYYGLHHASCGYFAVPPGQLNLAQASLLAGIVQAPSAYDPLKHPALARARQHYVLGRLVATGRVSPARSRAAAAAPWRLSHSGGGCAR